MYINNYYTSVKTVKAVLANRTSFPDRINSIDKNKHLWQTFMLIVCIKVIIKTLKIHNIISGIRIDWHGDIDASPTLQLKVF